MMRMLNSLGLLLAPHGQDFAAWEREVSGSRQLTSSAWSGWYEEEA